MNGGGMELFVFSFATAALLMTIWIALDSVKKGWARALNQVLFWAWVLTMVWLCWRTWCTMQGMH